MILTRLFEHDEEHERLHDARRGDLGVRVLGEHHAARRDDDGHPPDGSAGPREHRSGIGCLPERALDETRRA